MNDCDALLREMADRARALKIPIADNIEPHVVINSRAKTRFGCCKRRGDGYVIEVAARVADGPEESCRETLAHELLHTCPGCQNHGAGWKRYAQRMNSAYGYNISRTTTDEALGTVPAKPFRYILRCERCGAEIGRYKMSPLVRRPDRYRCRCGGRLKRVAPPK